MSKPTANLPTSIERKGSAAEALYGDDLGTGAQVGNYVVEELRSRGGFASVYRAKHVALDRIAALKVLHRSLSESEEMIDRFRLEARAVNMIRHRNIVDVFEYGELLDGRPYFMMEWLEGDDLQTFLAERGPIPVAETLALMEDICAALSEAHRAGIVHRDVKAANVVLVPAGEWYVCKVVDFGIAKLMLDDEGGELTLTGTRLGTPSNMAPEQIKLRAVDARTDVYALGVLLYQMLTGQLPFRSDNIVEIEEMHLNMPPPHVTDSLPVPAAVDDVVQRCLQKEPERRYPGVNELLDDLRRAVIAGPHREQRTKQQGMAIYVEARFDDVIEMSDALLDDLDAVKLATRNLLARLEVLVAADTTNATLGIAFLPSTGDAESALRERVLRSALDLKVELDRRATAVGGVKIAIAIHLGEIETELVRGEPQLIGGDILSLEWAERAPVDSISATRAALADLESRFATDYVVLA